MNVTAEHTKIVRALVAEKWRKVARIAHTMRLACSWLPWRNSPSHVAAAQFQLEVERARRASEENGLSE